MMQLNAYTLKILQRETHEINWFLEQLVEKIKNANKTQANEQVTLDRFLLPVVSFYTADGGSIGFDLPSRPGNTIGSIDLVAGSEARRVGVLGSSIEDSSLQEHASNNNRITDI